MRHTAFLATVAAAALSAGTVMAAEGDTLAQVKQRDVLNCGVNTGLVGFAAPDANGNWSGFDIAVCRAVAAAVLGDPAKVKYIPTTGQTRFTALTSGEVDLLARNSTWTFQRDTDLKMDFAAVNYYDGQGFMVRQDLGVSSATELDGATICIQTGTSTELNLADWFKANNMTYQPVNIDSNAEGEQQYMAGACDAYTTDASGLAATRAAFADPDSHIILPEIISKEPLAPAVRHGDSNWGDIVRWTLYALISAEEYGVTSANLDELSRSSTNPDVQRMLGATDDYGAMLGLDKEWAKRAIAASGNYGEIFAANIGEQTPIGLPRGLNALWTQGGLMYAMPFR
ncbi:MULTISPECIES: amino acid ABC transporter substrate-binding protein [unclassified Paracoccus (in: a-proteobacteria)]|uniref:amino acid ABC transporter substrate-binding protein n=1 Tax=unclassified Paracoccus (in: a-proteobacteria) TaxID=2688777 RepID=UPI0016000367|nr:MULTISPECIES: amino acid ABC transporter substrate-binding protein [unclassified Paracoccus (in: a-proteobacteria)]MBB1491087.1 amino acid ABC transporter substrate-binding protein [Paracoccus sp. MC1854]MBB1497098.1 amino acid ABC transporter substrate-binding protein [Paracoccus sp. MC1862]QQO44504.1 amino acid ABC transporter substrate-binding protein [Paracoccus sp. MC1862]